MYRNIELGGIGFDWGCLWVIPLKSKKILLFLRTKFLYLSSKDVHKLSWQYNYNTLLVDSALFCWSNLRTYRVFFVFYNKRRRRLAHILKLHPSKLRFAPLSGLLLSYFGRQEHFLCRKSLEGELKLSRNMDKHDSETIRFFLWTWF